MERLFHYIDENKDLYIEWLQELCRIPSVAAQNRGMEEAANKVLHDLQVYTKASARLIETKGFPIVFGEIKGKTSRTLSFYNHYDVQPEDPVELWDVEPFAAEIVDGKLIARGAADNKGNLMARIAAVHAYQQVYGELPINIKFIVEGEEEIGSPNLGDFAENNKELLQADGCIWEFGYKNADGRQQISLGVKGMVYVELICKGANTDLHSANAAIIENPAWRLIWALESMKNKENQVLIPGFYDDVAELTQEDYQLTKQFMFSEEETKEKFGIQNFVNNSTGEVLKRQLIFSPTCNICGFESGYTDEGAKTVLPSWAKVKLDFRLVPNQDPHKIVKQIREHLDHNGFADIEMKVYGLEYSARTAPDHPLVQSVVNAAEYVTKMEPTILPMSPGTGPMYELCQKFGIPAVSVGVGNFESNNHAPNENILIKDFIDGIKVIAKVIEEFAKQ